MCLLKTREFNDHWKDRLPISFYHVHFAAEDDVTTGIFFNNWCYTEKNVLFLTPQAM